MHLSDAEYWDSKAETRCRNENGVLHITGGNDRHNVVADVLLEFVRQEDRILEVGAGAAPIAVKVFNTLKGLPDYVNVDISPKFVEWVKNDVGLESVLGSADALPFENNRFDCVWFIDVLEHINPAMRLDVGEEVDRVLDLGGAVFINNPIFESKHDQRFEWILGDKDLIGMFPQFRIHQKQTYWIKQSPQEFIVLTRGHL